MPIFPVQILDHLLPFRVCFEIGDMLLLGALAFFQPLHHFFMRYSPAIARGDQIRFG